MGDSLAGETVVITGASAGIGEAVARRMAAEGATVVLAARGVERLQVLAAELGGIAVPTDVADIDACRALVHHAVERTGRLDVLVNNAGLHHRGGFGGHEAEAFAAMVDVNLRAPIVLTRFALPHLRASPRGAVVNIASLAGFLPLPDAAVYSSTKAGLRFFSRALAAELDGVRVTCVSPGPVRTGFILDELDQVTDLTLAQPMCSADDVAAMAVASALDGAVERYTPRSSGLLATIGYLAPWLRRALVPAMERRGRRNRRALQASRPPQP